MALSLIGRDRIGDRAIPIFTIIARWKLNFPRRRRGLISGGERGKFKAADDSAGLVETLFDSLTPANMSHFGLTNSKTPLFARVRGLGRGRVVVGATLKTYIDLKRGPETLLIGALIRNTWG